MDDKHKLQKMGVLFVAYHYLPTKGTGIPGSMRTIKFVRNMDHCRSHVLTVRSGEVSESESSLGHLKVPIHHETVHRAGSLDLLAFLLSMRRKLKNRFGVGEPPSQPVFKSTHGEDNGRAGIVQRFKDFIYHLFYFPDQASPWIPLAVLKGWRVVNREKIDVIFSTGSPWSGLVTGYFVSKISGVPLVVDFRDPWVGNPFHHSKGRWLDRLAARMEQRLVRHASAVSLNTEALKKEFMARYPDVTSSKFMVLPNGYDQSEFDGIAVQEHSDRNVHRFNLCHAGFLYGVRDPAPLLEAIRIVNDQYSSDEVEVSFDQIGHIKLDYDIYERYFDLVDNGSFRIHPQKTYKECLEFLSGADMLVNIQPGTKTQIPSKIYDYLALDRPILNITPGDGALGRMVEEYGFGALCDPGDIDSIVQALKQAVHVKTQGKSFESYPNRYWFDIDRISGELEKRLQTIVFGGSVESMEGVGS